MNHLSRTSLLLSFVTISCVSLIAACAAPTASGEEALGQEAEALTVVPVLTDFCATQSPDSVLYVPTTFAVPHRDVSATGFYGYARLCPKWILDIKLANYSNAAFNPTTGVYTPRPLAVTAGAFDLPSSSTAGGNMATTAEDCGRHVETMSIYLQDYNQSAFTFVGSTTRTGTWTAGACTLSGPPSPVLQQPPANTGWRTYRIVSSTKLRTSYQETSVTLTDVVPH